MAGGEGGENPAALVGWDVESGEFRAPDQHSMFGGVVSFEHLISTQWLVYRVDASIHGARRKSLVVSYAEASSAAIGSALLFYLRSKRYAFFSENRSDLKILCATQSLGDRSFISFMHQAPKGADKEARHQLYRPGLRDQI